MAKFLRLFNEFEKLCKQKKVYDDFLPDLNLLYTVCNQRTGMKVVEFMPVDDKKDITVYEKTEFYCPVCDSMIRKSDNYCRKCGQKIKF